MGFYAESYDRPNHSGIAQEDIHVGTIVAETSAGQVNLTDDSDTSADGLALAPRRGDYIADEPDETTNFKYKSADNDRVPYADLNEAAAVFKARTVKSGATNAPDISDGDVVGIAQKDDDAFRGRLVEEGYQDGSPGTTFNTSSNNFTVVGVAHRDSSSGFDEAVRFRVQN